MLMPFALIRRMADIRAREAAGLPGWEPDSIPDPPDPDGPPPEGQFVAYACSCGMAEADARAEYARQVAGGGYGRVVGRDGREY